MQKGDVGSNINITVLNEDLSTQTQLLIYYEKPSHESGFWTAGLSGTNIVQYTTLAGDIDESGTWKFQADITLSGGWAGRSKIKTHTVGENVI